MNELRWRLSSVCPMNYLNTNEQILLNLSDNIGTYLPNQDSGLSLAVSFLNWN